ncbi:hypothetical protein ACS0TY_011343 [Phlomoides rotata]
MLVEGFTELVFSMISDVDKSIAIRFCIVSSAIWKQRNSNLWDGMLSSAIKTVYTSGKWKINVNAAFFKESAQTGVGMMMKNDAGSFVQGRSLIILGCMDVDEGAALGFLEALSWAKSLGLDNGIIEGDAKVVVDGINSTKAFNSVFGDFVDACRRLVSSFQQIEINCVRRSANVVEHEIARVS